MHKYAEYMRNQVTELLTNYGKIDILWFDFSYDGQDGEGDQSWMKGKGKNDWEAEKLIATARSLQPDIIIDNRTDIEQDLWTPEQYQPVKWVTHPETGELVTWEACQTFSGSWGYYRDEQTWKSPEMLIRMLVNTVSCGGNLLMNVGPTSRGYLDSRAEDALKVYADWMKYNSRSIYGCTMAEPESQLPQTADTPRAPTEAACTCICLPIHSPIFVFPGWPERWNTPSSFMTEASFFSQKAPSTISLQRTKRRTAVT